MYAHSQRTNRLTAFDRFVSGRIPWLTPWVITPSRQGGDWASLTVPPPVVNLFDRSPET